MRLGFEEEQTPYESPTQSARFWTEAWVRSQAYCPNCGRTKIDKYENNRPAADFHCSSCREEYELKGQKTKFGAKVLDGAFRTMCERLAASDNPNLMLMNYDRSRLAVTDFFVVPKQFFVRGMIEERKPLVETTKRAGWVGCNILLSRVPDLGKVYLVRDGVVLPKDDVLEKWQKTLFLRDQSVDARGWMVEVMNCVELIGKPEFELDEVYAFESRLTGIYPNNRHVREKIRQQLQLLRDKGYLDFMSRGRYRLRLLS